MYLFIIGIEDILIKQSFQTVGLYRDNIPYPGGISTGYL